MSLAKSKSVATLDDNNFNDNNNNTFNTSTTVSKSSSQPTFLTSTPNINDENATPSLEQNKKKINHYSTIDSPPNGLIANRKMRNHTGDLEARYIREQIALKKKRAAAEEKLKQSLEAEVKTYSHTLEGIVFCYSIEIEKEYEGELCCEKAKKPAPTWEHHDSCGSFIGFPDESGMAIQIAGALGLYDRDAGTIPFPMKNEEAEKIFEQLKNLY